MRLRQPLVLLLGGLISASSAGCATWHAAVSETTSRPTSRKASAERMVSIARVFENQGQFDRAEVMYRKALRLTPKDETLKSQLAQLAERRSVKEFQADPTASAIARADAINGSDPRGTLSATAAVTGPASGRSAILNSESIVHGESPSLHDQAADLQIRLTASQQPAPPHLTGRITTADLARTVPGISEAPGISTVPEISRTSTSESAPRTHASELSPQWVDAAPLPPVELVAVDSNPTVVDSATSGGSSVELPEVQPLPVRQQPVSLPGLAEVLAAADQPQLHIELLIQAALGAPTVEAQGLAATLLGDCDPDNQAIRQCLRSLLNQSSDQSVLLAAADSQIQRGEADQQTARQMALLAADPTSAYQVQATTCLMHFAGTPIHTACADTLIGLLISQNPMVRASAAATLGDFADNNSIVLTSLTELAAEDPDLSVREAARSAIARRTANGERAEAVIVVPAR